jgi:hypothetical protein
MEAPRGSYWLAAIAIVGAIAQVLQWVEQSQWLPQWLSLATSRISLDFVTRLAVFVVLILGAVRLVNIEGRLAAASTQVKTPRQNDFTLVAHLDDGRRIVELDSKQYELGSGAFEYYSECNSHQKQQILSAMRNRFWHTLRWDKDDFVLIVDEKEALRRGVASLIQKGNEIEREIHFAPRSPEPKEPSLSLLASMPPAWRNNLTDWELQSRKWLEKNIPREAPAFARPPQFNVTGDSLLDGLAELNHYRDRLVDIQKRI